MKPINLDRSQVLAITGGLIVLFCAALFVFQCLATFHINSVPITTLLAESIAYNIYSRLLTVAVVVLMASLYYAMKTDNPEIGRLLPVSLGILLITLIITGSSYSMGLLQLAPPINGNGYFIMLYIVGFSSAVVSFLLGMFAQ